MSHRKRLFNFHEVISMLEDDNNFEQADIFVEPPPVREETDEDSGDDDEGGTLSNLNSHQLQAPASATVRRRGQRQQQLDEEDDTYSSSSEESMDSEESLSNAPVESTSTGRSQIQKRKAKQVAHGASTAKQTAKTSVKYRNWKHQDLTRDQQERFPWNKKDIDLSKMPSSPVALFELFFDKEMLKMIVMFSEKYARSKGNMTFVTTAEEIQSFIAILLLSGYSTVPRRRMYWSSDEDVGNNAVRSAMSRNRFEELLRYLHVSDNACLDAGDKLSKVRPLLADLNEKFLLYFKAVDSQNLSIDESMIPYYGRHGAKQFIRGKPIRFGYKMWVLSSPLGYVLQFEPYQGARGRQTEYAGLGMGGSVVVDLIAELQEERNRSYHLTFDNLFTSLNLVDALTDKSIACTGTIRANRLQKCPLRDVTEMKKTARGSYDHATDIGSGLTVVRWNDNNIVNVISNKFGVQPLQRAKRWSRAQSKQITVEQPFVIRHYNQTMGGVDRTDQNIAKYRTAIRSKKWWWPIFGYCLDLCIQQAWHLYRAIPASKDKSMDLLAIRRGVVQVYLARAQAQSLLASPGRPRCTTSLVNRVPLEVRYDRVDHLVQSWPTQVRCASCGMKTMRRCTKCRVGLHDRCFVQFHTK